MTRGGSGLVFWGGTIFVEFDLTREGFQIVSFQVIKAHDRGGGGVVQNKIGVAEIDCQGSASER